MFLLFSVLVTSFSLITHFVFAFAIASSYWQLIVIAHCRSDNVDVAILCYKLLVDERIAKHCSGFFKYLLNIWLHIFL